MTPRKPGGAPQLGGHRWNLPTAAMTPPHLPKNLLKPPDFFLVSGEDGRRAASGDFCRGTPARSRCSAALRSAAAEKNTTN